MTMNESGFDQRKIAKDFSKNSASLKKYEAKKCAFLSLSNKAENFCSFYELSNNNKFIVLWGDSTARVWLPVFLEIALSKQLNLIVFTHASCPPILGIKKTEFKFEASSKYCADGFLQNEIFKAIKKIRPIEIVLLGAWNSYSSYSNREYIMDVNSSLIQANSESTKSALAQNVPNTLLALSKIAPVLVFKSWPFLNEEPFYGKARLAIFSSRGVSYVNKDDFAKDSKDIDSIFAKISSPLISFFDPSEKLCINNICSAMLYGTQMYMDTYHITPEGALLYLNDLKNEFRFLNFDGKSNTLEVTGG